MTRSNIVRTIVAGAAGSVLAGTSPGTAVAATPVTVNLTRCIFSDHGLATVPDGSTVSVVTRFGESNRGRVQDFLNALTTSASVNGTPVANPGSLWSAITQAPDGSYLTSWLDPTGITLNSGDSMTVGISLVLSRKVPGGKDPSTGQHYSDGPGSIFPPGATCTITAS